MLNLGMRRCKADPNLYCHPSGDLYALCYVDDLLVCGKHELAVQFTKGLEKEVLLKIEAELKPGKSVNFLGRVLRHNGDSETFACRKTTSLRRWTCTTWSRLKR